MCEQIWVSAILIVLLTEGSAVFPAGFVDDFARPFLDSAWRVERLNSEGLLHREPLRGALRVTGIRHAAVSKPKNIYCKLIRSCGLIQGDFAAEMTLDWDWEDDAAMMFAMLEVLPADIEGKPVASAGLMDWWISAPGSVAYAVGPNARHVLGPRAPRAAGGTFQIERRGDIYTFRLKGDSWRITLAAVKGSGDNVGGVALSFAFFDYPANKGFPHSHFGEVAIEHVTLSAGTPPRETSHTTARKWELGKPIVTYWAGPDMTDVVARQLTEGGWNLAWARNPWDLDLLRKHGLRAILSSRLLTPKNLDSPDARASLDAFIDSVKDHPALYAYHIKDEPGASQFEDYARLAEYVRRKDPAHIPYFNLLPLGAKNRQLGTTGDRIGAYRKYVELYIKTVHPQILSYDHYHFADDGDGDLYFANLAVVREEAVRNDLPFMVIVQACSWTRTRRIPTGEELRWLASTILAYGAQGISYYVYGYRGHDGAMINLTDGSPTSLYWSASHINREFLGIASQLRPLNTLGAYHIGMQPPGTALLPEDAPFQIEPPVPVKSYPATHPSREGWPPRYSSEPVEGFVIGLFGKTDMPTHAFVVNLDYRTYTGRGQSRREEFLKPVSRYVAGPGALEFFEVRTGKWTAAHSNKVRLLLPPGAGILVRMAQQAPGHGANP